MWKNKCPEISNDNLLALDFICVFCLLIIKDTDSLSLGPFLVSPKEFELLPGESNDLHLTFTPPEIGWFSKDVSMACDNGQVLTFTLTG